LAPLLESASRFAAAARKFFAELQTDGPSGGQAARNFGDFLRAETLEFFPCPASAVWGAAGPPPTSVEAPPALGPQREHQLRWQRGTAAGRRVFAAQMQLHLLWSDALREAALAFAARLPTLRWDAANGAVPDIESLRAAYAAWIDCAEEAYARVAHSDSFCSALAECVNAGSALRTEARASSELGASALDLPTRSELNSLLRRVNALEEQLRSKDAPRPSVARRAKGPRV